MFSFYTSASYNLINSVCQQIHRVIKLLFLLYLLRISHSSYTDAGIIRKMDTYNLNKIFKVAKVWLKHYSNPSQT